MEICMYGDGKEHAPSQRGAARTSHSSRDLTVDRRLTPTFAATSRIVRAARLERPNDHHRDDTTTKFRYRCALELKIHFGI